MNDCLFCKIAQRKIPAQIVYEDEAVLAFKDIAPQAPVHLLIIPIKHFTHLSDLELEPPTHALSLLRAVQKLAQEFKIAESGYRTVMNTNPQGGQSVYHLHLHLLGGKQMGGEMTGS